MTSAPLRGGRVLLVLLLLPAAGPLAAMQGPAGWPGAGGPIGGLEELATSTIVRPRLPARDVARILPAARGRFSFPPPYASEAYRITIPGDCGGGDCVNSVGYSYWPNINNHAGEDRVLIMLTLAPGRGGAGPSLFEIHKRTGAVRSRGPLFSAHDERRQATGEGWYFSAHSPHMLYAPGGSRLTRIDVQTRVSRPVFDLNAATDVFGDGRTVWQAHSSADDTVHSFTVMGERALGCGVFLERFGEFRFYPTTGTDYDECQVDKSGRWLVIKEQLDHRQGEDNRIINLESHHERWLLDEEGAGGHSDLGFGAMVAADNWFPTGMAWRLWDFNSDPLGPRTVVYSDPSWQATSVDHVSWQNAVDGPADSQYACGSGMNRVDAPRVGEIVCFILDGSLRTVVVAPVMTDLDAPGGEDEYWRLPKGNLDPTGEYFIWTTNAGGDRLDAFVVRVPVDLLRSYLPRRFAAPRVR